MSTSVDIAVVGGGLAGLEFARRASRRGPADLRLTVIDASSPRRGSDAPGAMLHPFPGRRLEPSAEILEGCRFTLRAASEWAAFAPRGTVRALPMARPLLPGDVGDDLLASWRAHREDYPDWIASRPVGAGDLAGWVRGGDGLEGALLYAPARQIDLAALRRGLRYRIRRLGVEWRRARARRLTRGERGWRVETTAGELTAERLVLAVGRAMDAWFPDLDLRGRGGELLTVAPPADTELRCAVNAGGGHVAPTSRGLWVAGSSWWSEEALFERSESRASEAVGARCERAFPPFRRARTVSIWRGIRAKYVDNRPLVGRIPGIEDLYVLGAFGSKGLIRIPIAADRLARLALGAGADIPGAHRPERVPGEQWRPAVGWLTF